MIAPRREGGLGARGSLDLIGIAKKRPRVAAMSKRTAIGSSASTATPGSRPMAYIALATDDGTVPWSYEQELPEELR
jgi:hypothetical protein